MAQAFAIIIFLAMFILIIMDKWPKQYVTLGCALLTLILVFGVGMHSMDAVIETLNVKSIFTQGSGTQAVRLPRLQAVSTGRPSYSLQA